VLQSNSASIRELELSEPYDEVSIPTFFLLATVQHFLAAAPQLQVFRSNVAASVREDVRVLRNEAPFGPLHVRCLHVLFYEPQAADADEGGGGRG
jgi:hypothetical protein